MKKGKYHTSLLNKSPNGQEMRSTIKAALYKQTQNKKTENLLSKNDRRFHKLSDHMNEGIFVQDNNGFVTFVNERFLKMSGYRKDEVIGHLPSEFLSEENNEKFRNRINRIKSHIPDTYEVEWKKKNGKKILMNVSLIPIRDNKGNFKESIALLKDITDSRQIEKELKKSREELRSLYRHLHSIREKESKRISREIHDELGQTLTALKMELSWLAGKLPGSINKREHLVEKIKSMSDLVDETIKEVQRISSELRPGILDDLGLGPAIEWQAQDFQRRTKIECVIDLDSNGIDLDPEFSTAVFRIFQEALTNIARHAEATKVRISLERKNSRFEMKIRDNGKGIKQKDILSPSSLGLIGMRERLRPFNGKLKLIGIRNRGTTVYVTIPVYKSPT